MKVESVDTARVDSTTQKFNDPDHASISAVDVIDAVGTLRQPEEMTKAALRHEIYALSGHAVRSRSSGSDAHTMPKPPASPAQACGP